MTFIKGQPAWNKGLTWNNEIKARISESKRGQQAWNKGKKLSDQHIKNIKEGLKRSKKVLT